MKKIISFILIMLLTLGLTACAEASLNKTTENKAEEEIGESITDESEKNMEIETGDRNVLVVCFSVTGNTLDIAEMIASLTGADIYEIKPAIEYSHEDINYGDSNSRTSKEQNDPSVRPEIGSEPISLEEYDTIFVGYPIWWGEEPRIMDTFVESYDFGNITMIPFCTSASSGIGNSAKNLAKIARSGNWLDGKRFSAQSSKDEIEAWISELHQ